MAVLLEYKCPNCGGDVQFDTAKQSFLCEFCDSVFTEAQLKSQLSAAERRAEEDSASDVSADSFEAAAATKADEFHWEGQTTEALGEMSLYSCRSCGAQITTDLNTAAAACPYCGSPIIMMGKVSGLNKPNCIIPFKLDKKAACDALKTLCKGKILLPSHFLDGHTVEEIKGVYVPFWLFSSDAVADIHFEGTRTRSWSDSDYRYTETSFFDIHRAGNVGFADIPVDASTKMPDDYMDGIEPFEYKDFKDFNPAFLSGFMAEKYDVEAKDAFSRAQTRIKNSAESAFRNTVSGYSSVTAKNVNIFPSNSRYKYAMLPVWLLNTSYNGKKYTYAVNGQTGKVSGTLPIDKKKTALIFAGITAVITAIAQFFIF